MDCSRITVLYGCFYCKKTFGIEKGDVKEHWNKGCSKMVGCYTADLLVKFSDTFQTPINRCLVYVNPRNIDVDVNKSVLPLISWPEQLFRFTSENNWKDVEHDRHLWCTDKK
jgi:hypothetical protein